MGKTLIVYYSWVGNTAAVAQEIQAQTGYDLRPIEEKKLRKPGAYAGAAMAGFFGIGGAIRPMDFSLEGYDRVLLGSPVWAGNPPPAVKRFLHRANLTGRRVWLFITKADDKLPQKVVDTLTARVVQAGGTVAGVFSATTKMDSVVPVEDYRQALLDWLEEQGLAVERNA
ncbi:MAG: hypothetical protein KBA30_01765 [Clostridia bacterium]|nr:hypothetical protein [Clostridia bacterium]